MTTGDIANACEKYAVSGILNPRFSNYKYSEVMIFSIRAAIMIYTTTFTMIIPKYISELYIAKVWPGVEFQEDINLNLGNTLTHRIRRTPILLHIPNS